jgi:hypothetical protein
MGITILAPLLRRFNKASLALASGAIAVLVFSVLGLVYNDPRNGQAAVDANRKEYLFFLASEIPVSLLALISWKRFKWAFWVGWGINVVLSLIVLAVIIEFEFFWHW